jgi:3-isopropylmalate/(R)-2-methylmalate dehydratase small subunit
VIIDGYVLPIDRADIDTDQIIPAHLLTGVETSGLGQHLFKGMPGGRELLENAHPKANVLVARENFGCGSSREHAAWSIKDRGFHAVIAPSFARIFHENAYSNGLAPIVVEAEQVERLLAAERLEIDLIEETIVYDDGTTLKFSLDPLRKQFLLEGGYMEFMAKRVGSVRNWLASRPA